MRVGSLSLDQRLLMTCLESLRVILRFLPHQQTIKTIKFYYFLLTYRRNHMQFSTHIRNWQGQIVSHQEFEYEEEEVQQSNDSPGLYVYELLRSLLRKQIRYPFQQLKQFYLFPEDDEASIEVGYKYMHYEVELAMENIKAVSSLIKQRSLVDGFVTIKLAYFRKLRVEAAYYNVENLVKLQIGIVSIENISKIWLKWEGFGKLYENLKGMKLSKINLSKIEMVSNDYTSKQLDDFNPFFADKCRQIEQIHSYVIDRSSQNEQDLSQDEQGGKKLINQHRYKKTTKGTVYFSDINQQNEKNVKRQQTNTKSDRKMFVGKTQTNAKEKHQEIASPILIKSNEKDELEHQVLITHRKEGIQKQAGSTNKVVQQIEGHIENQEQQIYLIRDYHSKKKQPSNFIKIPVASQNIKIVEIHTGRKKKHRKRQQEIIQENDVNVCENCKYCQQVRQRRQIMKVIQQRLEMVSITKQGINKQMAFGTASEWDYNSTANLELGIKSKDYPNFKKQLSPYPSKQLTNSQYDIPEYPLSSRDLVVTHTKEISQSRNSKTIIASNLSQKGSYSHSSHNQQSHPKQQLHSSSNKQHLASSNREYLGSVRTQTRQLLTAYGKDHPSTAPLTNSSHKRNYSHRQQHITTSQFIAQ